MLAIAVMKRAFVVGTSALFGAILTCVAASGKDSRSKLEQPARIPSRHNHRDPLFRTDANPGLVRVTVTDPLGRTVNGLDRDSFKILDDKVPQRIVSFGNEDTPCSVGLLFDASGGMKDKIVKARLATRVFSIPRIRKTRPYYEEEKHGIFPLEHLAEAAGGRHYVIRDVNELSDVAARIGLALHDQYALGYHLPENTPGGKWRSIEVKVDLSAGLPRLRVDARSGYYAPER